MIKKFKEFLQEVEVAHRVGIKHLKDLRPIDFIGLLNYFKKELKGILSTNDKVSIEEKIDGSRLIFGFDERGDFFIKSSYSPPIKQPGDYTKYVISRGYSENEISKAFENVFKLLKNYKPLQNLLEKYHKPNIPLVILCELLYNPLGKEINPGKIRFVNIDYDKTKLGKTATLILINVDGIEKEKLDEFKKEFETLSNTEIKFFSDTKIKTTIDLSYEIENFFKEITKNKSYEEALRILQSRKKADKEEKELLKALIEKYKEKIANKIIKAIKQGKLGDEFEGIVLKLYDGRTIKVINPIFTKRKEGK